MNHVVSIAKALSDPSRVRVLCVLRGGELCACQIIELLDLAPSTVSRHLAVLAQAGLVLSRKQGKWMHYRLADEKAPDAVRQVLGWVFCCCTADQCIESDEATMRAILRLSPEELCGLQASGQKCCSSAPATPAGARSPKDGPGCCGAT